MQFNPSWSPKCYNRPLMRYDVNKLLIEAKAKGLHVQSLCETYWSRSEPRWTCWLREDNHVQYGSGNEAGEALNAALNATPELVEETPITIHQPTPQTLNLSFDLPSLESLMPSHLKSNVKIIPGAVRRHLQWKE